MKIEFIEMKKRGACIKIKPRQLRQADKHENEFMSLFYALCSLSSFYGFQYTVTHEDIQEILRAVEDYKGYIYIVAAQGNYPKREWLQFFIKDSGRYKLIYEAMS